MTYAMLLAVAAIVLSAASAMAAPMAFVTRQGSALMLDGAPFRFSGADIDMLGDEEVKRGRCVYPTHFRVDDTLAMAQAMGANVVRTFACASVGEFGGYRVALEPTLGHFNPKAFAEIDYAINSARRHHVRLIMILGDSWNYYVGGEWTYSDWIEPSVWKANPRQAIVDFFTNPAIVKAYEEHISAVLDHVNRYTGVAYKDDPTIMAWETGNEMAVLDPHFTNDQAHTKIDPAPRSWTTTIANYIKRLAPKQLVVDGNYMLQDSGPNSSLKIASVDMLDGHYYPMDVGKLRADASSVTAGGKAFFAGEYGWNDTRANSLAAFLAACRSGPVSGDLLWCMFGHWDTYGYDTNGGEFTLHYPGDNPTMVADTQMLRNHAYAMRSLPAPPPGLPGAPLITSVSSVGAVAWRGSVPSATYEMERSSAPSGPWTVVTKNATDSSAPFTDRPSQGGSIYYRVRGANLAGVYGPFSPVYHMAP